MEELVQDYELTRRETEILGLVFQDLNNEEILDRLHISRHTLLKHLQNLYRKCGFLPLGPAEAAALKGERRCTRRDLPMETNDFLLYNEVLYRLHACRTMEELKPTLLGQLKLMIPYTYASFLSIQVDPETQELVHRDPFCQPRQFEAAERAWLGQIDQSYSIWLSHAPESMVVRDSEILSGDNRFSAPSYRKIYLDYHIYDCMQMNITYAGQAMGRLAFYRTQADGLFTDRGGLSPAYPVQPH